LRTGHSRLVMTIEGRDALACLAHEIGGHRVQRVPPTEARGRVHSSTVTVAVLGGQNQAASFDEADVEIQWFSGTGCGGQHRNKHQNSARAIHRPTGIVRTAQTRSRDNSRALAVEALRDAVNGLHLVGVKASRNDGRRDQIGSGERSDKRRTWRWQDDTVQDHVTGRRGRLSDILKGGHAVLWH